MVNGAKDDDIREIMAEETRRGRRPLDAREIERKKHEREILRELLRIDNEQEFLKAIRELGYADDPERTDLILKAWRTLASSRRR